jgi:hypothetical protein
MLHLSGRQRSKVSVHGSGHNPANAWSRKPHYLSPDVFHHDRRHGGGCDDLVALGRSRRRPHCPRHVASAASWSRSLLEDPQALRPREVVDGFGRTVSEVIGDINYGFAMLEDGQAFAYQNYLGHCDAKEYLDAEIRASRRRTGVWRVPGGITRPWDFRRFSCADRCPKLLLSTKERSEPGSLAVRRVKRN